jgi:hypothetical protein
MERSGFKSPGAERFFFGIQAAASQVLRLRIHSLMMSVAAAAAAAVGL